MKNFPFLKFRAITFGNPIQKITNRMDFDGFRKKNKSEEKRMFFFVFRKIRKIRKKFEFIRKFKFLVFKINK